MMWPGVALLCSVAVVGCARDDGTLGDRDFVSESIEGRSLIPGTRVRLHFFDDGAVNASAGCNAMPGDSYHLADGELVIDSLGITEKGCSGPAGDYHAQDDWLLEFLLSRPSYTLDEPRLVLDDGSVTLVLLDREVADPDRTLQGRVWRVSGIIDGGFGVVFATDDPSALEFGDDGHVTIVTPCATGSAGYRVDGATIELSDGAIAMPACAADESSPVIDEHMRSVLADGALDHEIDASHLTLMRGDIGLMLRTE
jgi:heat shock protein HslJ